MTTPLPDLLMPAGLTLGYDATARDIPHLPKNVQVAGYDTEAHPGDGIAWTPQDYAQFHNPLHICQLDATTNPPTSDYIVMERFAATPDDVAMWYPEAKKSFMEARRPGQRWPACYVSASNVPALLKMLRARGINDGLGLIIANWSITEQQSELEVLTESKNAFPVVGAQFASGQFYDVDLYLTHWLTDVSAPVPKLTPLAMLRQAQASISDADADLAEAITDIAAIIKTLNG